MALTKGVAECSRGSEDVGILGLHVPTPGTLDSLHLIA